MENLHLYLLIAAGILTVLEILGRWVAPKLRQGSFRSAFETVDSLWVAIVLALGVRTLWLQPYKIPSASMEDTLLVGDYILVKKFTYGYSLFNRTDRFLKFSDPRRGDVAVFVFPEDRSKDYIKRVVGVPGDVLEMRNKVLFVNGVAQAEPYVHHEDPRVFPKGLGPWDRDNWGPVTVKAGHYFMLGDNRDNSADSRKWGQLDGRLLKGKAWVIYWHSNNFRPGRWDRIFRKIH